MIDNLKAFAAVVDSKSLTKAASRLFLTQSAISRRIQQLEEALGGTLLDRTSDRRVPLRSASASMSNRCRSCARSMT